MQNGHFHATGRKIDQKINESGKDRDAGLLLHQLAHILEVGLGAAQVIGHDQGVIGKQAEA